MDHLKSIFKEISFTDQDEVFDTLQREGIEDVETLKEANEDDLRKSGLKMGDIIKIRKTLANLTGDLESSLSSNTSGASDTTEEPSVTEPGDHGVENHQDYFRASEMLEVPKKGARCTKAQLYFRTLLRDCARQAKIWDKAYPLPSIPDSRLQKFLELITAAALYLAKHKSQLRVRLGNALQNRRKYIADLKDGKRKKKNGVVPNNGTSIQSTIPSTIERSPSSPRKRKSNIVDKSGTQETSTDVSRLAFKQGEEVLVFKTVEKKCKLAKAAYLGPNKDEDTNDMYSLLQLRSKYLSDGDDEIPLPEINSEGNTTLNELECNGLFTWKTKKLGVGVQLQSKAASGPPTKKFKANYLESKEKDKQIGHNQNDVLASSVKSKSPQQQASLNKDTAPCSVVKGHDKQELHINDWVAVAYDSQQYVGQILSISSKDAIKVNFLAQKKDGTFRWPKQRDTDIVSHKYIFSHGKVQKVGNCFVVSNLESIDRRYKIYKEIYMNAVI